MVPEDEELLTAVKELEPSCPSINDRKSLERWWMENALSNLTREMQRYERENVRSRSWYHLTQSLNKILTAKAVVEKTTDQFAQKFHESYHGLVDTLIIYLTGSSARFECERTSDIEMDILFEDMGNRKDVIKDDVCRKLKAGIEERSEAGRDIFPWPLDKLEKELKSGKYDIVVNILSASYPVYHQEAFTALHERIKSRAKYDKLIKAIERIAKKDLKSLCGEGRFGPGGKEHYHVARYCMQMLSLKFLSQTPILRRPYWKIADSIEQPSKDRNLWEHVQLGVLRALELREDYPKVREIERATKQIQTLYSLTRNIVL